MIQSPSPAYLNTLQRLQAATFQVARLHPFFVVVLQNNVVLLRNVTERFATLRSDRIKVSGGLRVHTRRYLSFCKCVPFGLFVGFVKPFIASQTSTFLNIQIITLANVSICYNTF